MLIQNFLLELQNERVITYRSLHSGAMLTACGPAAVKNESSTAKQRILVVVILPILLRLSMRFFTTAKALRSLLMLFLAEPTEANFKAARTALDFSSRSIPTKFELRFGNAIVAIGKAVNGLGH